MAAPVDLVGAPHLQKREQRDVDLSSYVAPASDAADDAAADEVRRPWPRDLWLLVDDVKKARRPAESRRVVCLCVVATAPSQRGAVANCRLARAHYAGWRVVVFASPRVDAAVVDELGSWGAEVRVVTARCRDFQLPLLRFAVAGEVGVECVVFRDAEHRINAREGAAVRDWLATDAAFHVMHDALDADARFIASGCFGCRSTDEHEPPLPDAPAALVEFVDGGGDDDLAWLEIYVRPACDAANTVHHSSRGAFLDDGPARPFPETDYRGRVGEAAGDAPWDAFL